MVCVFLFGYIHAYDNAHHRLLAMREAEQRQTEPYACLTIEHRELGSTMKNMLISIVSPERPVADCARYIERTTQSVWPNMIYVLFEIPTRCITQLMDNFTYPMQIMCVLVMLMLLFYAPTYLSANANRPHQQDNIQYHLLRDTHTKQIQHVD